MKIGIRVRRGAARLLAALAVVGGLACAGAAGAADAPAWPLKGAVDVAARRALIGRPGAPFTCPSPPLAVRDMEVGGFYTGQSVSTIVGDALARKRAITRPVDEFTRRVAEMSDAWIATRPADPAPARCALAWLAAWADGEAMLGRMSQQGRYEQQWRLAGWASAWLKIREAPELDPTQAARVASWLGRLADAVRPNYDREPEGPIPEVRNNHAYWAGLAVAAAGAAIGDRTRFDWGLSRYRLGIDQIAADGTLPLELARKGRALHYHLFALLPLVMLAEFGEANGIPLYAARDGAIHRLVRVTVEGLNDPALFERLTGTRQDVTADKIMGEDPGAPYGLNASWMEPYYSRFRTPALAVYLKKLRPMRTDWLGGDLTVDFGMPDLP